MTHVERLIGRMQSARDNHLDWARWQEKLRRRGEEDVPIVGCPSHHRRWVKVYDEVIEVLNRYREG